MKEELDFHCELRGYKLDSIRAKIANDRNGIRQRDGYWCTSWN